MKQITSWPISIVNNKWQWQEEQQTVERRANGLYLFRLVDSTEATIRQIYDQYLMDTLMTRL